MKAASVLLALFFLSLSIVWCNDNDAESNCGIEVHYHAEGHDEDADSDLCSPLCVCQCCHNHIITLNLNSGLVVSFILANDRPESSSMLYDGVSRSIWDPPKYG